MLKLLFPILLLGYVAFAACTDANGTNSRETTIVLDSTLYEIIKLEKTVPGCVETEENFCTKASVDYVQVTQTTNSAVKDKINKTITDSLRRNAATIEESLDTFIQEFVTSNEQLLKEIEDYQTIPWESLIAQDVTYNTSRIFTVATSYYMFTGGAHGIHGTTYMNFDVTTGKLLTLDDLFTDRAQLETLGATYFRQQHDLDEKTTWEDSGYWFENNQFYLPDNFALTEDGVLFIYSIYEIASYVEGEQEVKIPYSALTGLLKADSPIK